MDLGIAGRRGIVCASSQGLGRACAEALAEEGVHLVVNGRDVEKLEKTAADLRNLPGIDREVVAVAADITTDAGRAALLAACPPPTSSCSTTAGRSRASSPTRRPRTSRKP